MRKLSIPYTIDGNTLDLLGDNVKYIKEIYMPLPYDIMPSGRPYVCDETQKYKSVMDSEITRAKEMGLEVSILATKPILDINDGPTTIILASREILRLREELGIDKVVISNFPFLKMYGEHFKQNGLKIELSVIAGVDSVDKMEQIMSIYPFLDSVCLHNNFLLQLDDIKYIKQKFPRLNLKIMVAHGCLFNCVSHFQHHNALCCQMYSCESDKMNEVRLAGNIATLLPPTKICEEYSTKNEVNPIKDTSFIRPEDVHHYDDVIDTFKISGRASGANRLMTAIEAYGKRQYEGDLRDIIDIPYSVSKNIDNQRFPSTYMDNKINCHRRCRDCNYCDTLAKTVLR